MTVFHVCSATMVVDRMNLGEAVTKWAKENKIGVRDVFVNQSSDDAFHCISVAMLGEKDSEGRFLVGGKWYSAMKVFTATKAKEREGLGMLVTDWLTASKLRYGQFHVDVRQSSDAEFHCLSIVIFY